MKRSIFVIMSLLTLSACGSAEDEKSSYIHVDKPYPGIEFVLPHEDSISISYKGDGIYEETTEMHVENFEASDTDGWQVYVTGNVWSDKGRSGSVDRQGRFSAFFKGLSDARKVAGMDFEINFIQVDSFPRQLKERHAEASGLGLTPDSKLGCKAFWQNCTDRYIVSPYTRLPSDGFLSQKEWLKPYLKRVEDDIHNGGNSVYLERQGFNDENSDYWNSVPMNVFIVNPDGEVVDAIVPLASGRNVSPHIVMQMIASAQGVELDQEVFSQVPQITTVILPTEFGGSYREIFADELADLLLGE